MSRNNTFDAWNLATSEILNEIVSSKILMSNSGLRILNQLKTEDRFADCFKLNFLKQMFFKFLTLEEDDDIKNITKIKSTNKKISFNFDSFKNFGYPINIFMLDETFIAPLNELCKINEKYISDFDFKNIFDELIYHYIDAVCECE